MKFKIAALALMAASTFAMAEEVVRLGPFFESLGDMATSTQDIIAKTSAKPYAAVVVVGAMGDQNEHAEIHENGVCEIRLNTAVRKIGHLTPAPLGKYLVFHEVGHCIALSARGALPEYRALRQSDDTRFWQYQEGFADAYALLTIAAQDGSAVALDDLQEVIGWRRAEREHDPLHDTVAALESPALREVLEHPEALTVGAIREVAFQAARRVYEGTTALPTVDRFAIATLVHVGDLPMLILPPGHGD